MSELTFLDKYPGNVPITVIVPKDSAGDYVVKKLIDGGTYVAAVGLTCLAAYCVWNYAKDSITAIPGRVAGATWDGVCYIGRTTANGVSAVGNYVYDTLGSLGSFVAVAGSGLLSAFSFSETGAQFNREAWAALQAWKQTSWPTGSSLAASVKHVVGPAKTAIKPGAAAATTATAASVAAVEAGATISYTALLLGTILLTAVGVAGYALVKRLNDLEKRNSDLQQTVDNLTTRIGQQEQAAQENVDSLNAQIQQVRAENGLLHLEFSAWKALTAYVESSTSRIIDNLKARIQNLTEQLQKISAKEGQPRPLKTRAGSYSQIAHRGAISIMPFLSNNNLSTEALSSSSSSSSSSAVSPFSSVSISPTTISSLSARPVQQRVPRNATVRSIGARMAQTAAFALSQIKGKPP